MDYEDPSPFVQALILIAFGLFFTAVVIGYCH